MDETPQVPEGESGWPTEPSQPIQPTQPTPPTQPIDPWANPDSVAQPVQPVPPVEPAQPISQPTQPITPVQPVSQPTSPTQPYGDPYAAGYTGAAWGTSAVPPVDPWLPLAHSLPQTDVLEQGTTKGGSGRRYGGLTLVAVAVLAGLISAAGVSAVVIATRPANDGTSSSFSSTSAASTANTSIDRSRPAGTIAAVAQAVLPSVVSILETNGNSAGEGSGIVLDTQGHILTNNHVVADAANGGSLTVTFQDGSSAKATIVGRDPLTDIAVIKIAPSANLKPARLGSSASLRVGDQVVAIGSPLGLSGTVTEGIVSALNRPVVTQQDSNSSNGSQAAISAIQTDAAINPGNSGGALVDADGAVVGINSAIATVASQTQGGQAGNIGVGFAIPIDQAKRIAAELIAGQTPAHAVLGVTLDQSQESTFTTVGAKVSQLTSSDGAAAKAGIKAGDVISKVNGDIVQGPDGLRATIRSFAPGTTVDLTYVRGGVNHTIKVTLGTDAKG